MLYNVGAPCRCQLYNFDLRKFVACRSLNRFDLCHEKSPIYENGEKV